MSNFRTSLLASATAFALLSAPLAFAQSTDATATQQNSTQQNSASMTTEANTSTVTTTGTQSNWDALDIDRDGKLSRAEANADPALVIVFADIDGDADGALTADEYRGYAERASAEAGAAGATAGVTAGTGTPATATNSADGKMSWTDIDTDKDGNISKTEAAAMPALDRVFADADADADGLLTGDEYRGYAERASAEGAAGAETDTDAGANVDADVDADVDVGKDDGVK